MDIGEKRDDMKGKERGERIWNGGRIQCTVIVTGNKEFVPNV